MKKWVLTTLAVVGLAILTVWAPQWLPLLLGFVGARSDFIQGLEALVQLVVLVVGAVLTLLIRPWGFRRSKQPQRSGTRVSGEDNGGKRNVIIDGDVSDSILTTGNQNVIQEGSSNVHITVNKGSSSLKSTVEAERAKAERIRAETDAKVIDHFLSRLKQNESPLTGRLGPNTGINTSEQLPCQSEKLFFGEENQAQTTDDTSKISLPHDSLPPAGQTPGMEQAEELAEQLSDHWSISSAERASLPSVPDAQKWSLETAGQQYLVTQNRHPDVKKRVKSKPKEVNVT